MSLVMNDIKYFVTISETLNITRASEIIGISQPALSYALKRLENKLGGELLVRLKKGVQLTKLGEEFKRRSKELLYAWEQAQNLVDSELGLIQGTYTIAVHPSVALYTLEHFIPELQDVFPKLNFKFIHGLSRTMTEKVINWEADFGIVVNPVRHPDLVVSTLCHDEVSIFHAPDAKHQLIYDDNLAQSRHILNTLDKRKYEDGVLNSENLEVVGQLTSLGLGYGLLPGRVARQYSHLIRLADAPVFSDEICLVYRAEKHYNPVSQKIVKIIKSASYH